jgi:hypothetical protein
VRQVWALVTDVRLAARLSPELQRVAWLGDADRPMVGARFEGYNHHPKLGEWRTVSHVVEVDEQRVFAWAVTDADGRYGEPTLDPAKSLASWRYALEAAGRGTLLRQSVLIGPGRSGVTLGMAPRPTTPRRRACPLDPERRDRDGQPSRAAASFTVSVSPGAPPPGTDDGAPSNADRHPA